MFSYVTQVVVCYVNFRNSILYPSIKIDNKYVWGISVKKNNAFFFFIQDTLSAKQKEI